MNDNEEFKDKQNDPLNSDEKEKRDEESKAEKLVKNEEKHVETEENDEVAVASEKIQVDNSINNENNEESKVDNGGSENLKETEKKEFGKEEVNEEVNKEEFRKEKEVVNEENDDLLPNQLSIDEIQEQNFNKEDKESLNKNNDVDNKNNDEFLLQAASYYTENYKNDKDSKKIKFLIPMIIASIASAVIGGIVVALIFVFATSVLKPDNKNLYQELFSGEEQYTASSKDLNASKIQIEKSDSPVSWIAKKVSPSIVGISVSFKSADFFFQEQSETAEGSGIIFREDGYIMTNYHVIEKYNTEGTKLEVTLPNDIDKKYEATVIGGDRKTDLAVIKIDVKGLPAVELGNSEKLEVGEMAVAIGNPGGLEYMGSVTVGVVSGLNRTIPVDDNTVLKLIQTDASINPGNSGGALVNSEGKVIGINTAKIGGDGYEGLGFAIPINEAKEITNNLVEYKYVKGRPQVGVVINPRYTEDYAKQNKYPVGLLVDSVVPLSGAFKAGILRGDIIVKFDGKDVAVFDDLEKIKNNHKPGDKIKIELYRDDKKMNVTVELTEEKASQ